MFWWTYEENEGSYRETGEKILSGVSGAKGFGTHIDHYENLLVVTLAGGMEVFDLSGSEPVRKHQFNFYDNLPGFDANYAALVVNKCEINAQYIACGVGVEVIE